MRCYLRKRIETKAKNNNKKKAPHVWNDVNKHELLIFFCELQISCNIVSWNYQLEMQINSIKEFFLKKQIQGDKYLKFKFICKFAFVEKLFQR